MSPNEEILDYLLANLPQGNALTLEDVWSSSFSTKTTVFRYTLKGSSVRIENIRFNTGGMQTTVFVDGQPITGSESKRDMLNSLLRGRNKTYKEEVDFKMKSDLLKKLRGY